ncbi:MAG TPA: ABC transporter permease [Candidatus Acidoferrum sp.]|nr:ABC transporter permease [Candidatus Acidoferrum sp.]
MNSAKSFRAWFQRLAGLFRKSKRDAEFAAELQSHLQLHMEDNLSAGMTPEAARRDALMKLGGVEQTKDNYRDRRGLPLFESFFQDIRFATRVLRKSPGFTAVVVLTLALGIGANTTIFTLLHASLWRPLPVEDPQQIFHLMRASSSGDFAGEFSYSYPLSQQFSKTAAPWGEVFATDTLASRKFGWDAVSSERVVGEAVSDNFFSVLGVWPILGRVFEPQDDSVLGGNHVAVLSQSFWTRRCQSDPSILGKTIFYDEKPFTVVGVARPGFAGIEPEATVDVWVPITASSDPDTNLLRLLARLRPGIDPARVQAVFEAAFRTHVSDTLWPTASPRFRQMLAAQHITVRPAASGLATTGRKYEKPLLVLLAVVATVLLISCANIANLMLARNASRRQEILVRLALGASRARIACQLLTENFILSLSGGGFAILLSVWGTRLLVSLLPPSPLPLTLNLRPDLAVLAFTASIATATAILFGLGPALRASREKLGMGFHGADRIIGSPLNGRFLLTGQLALSLPLLVGAGLFLETLHNLKTTDLGFRPENVVTFGLSFPRATSKDRQRQDCAEIKKRLESHTGVSVASYSRPGIYEDGGWSGGVEVLGRPTPGEDNDVGLIAGGPGFFESIGLGLLQGRYLNDHDLAENPPVAVVNESFARHYFGGDSAIGQHIKLGGIVRQIVGVVRDARHYGVRQRIWRMVYLPAQEGESFFVRTNLNGKLLSGLIRADVAATDKIPEVEDVRPLEAAIDDMVSQEHLTAILSSIFAVLACLLAAIGLYGVVAYGVSRRTNEFGIRMALGAGPSDIWELVLWQTVPFILGGIAAGVAVALGLTRALSALIAGMLYGVKQTDIATLAVAITVLVAIALVSAFLPAWRASRVDPITALRYE